MPVYEYECGACGHQFEEWQKISDPPVKVCPKCKKKKVERLISRTAFQLKGGGWYKDLYSSSTPSAGNGEAKSDSGKSESKSEAKSEAKSEGKAESKSSDAGAKAPGGTKDSGGAAKKESKKTGASSK